MPKKLPDPPPPPVLPDPPVEAVLEGELPLELADAVAITGRIPPKTREQMRALWWRTYAPLFAAIGRGDLLPARKRVWKRQGDTLVLVSDQIIETTPSLETRVAFSDRLLSMGFDAEHTAQLPAMAPLVWDLSRERQVTPPADTPMVQGLMDLAKQAGKLS